MAQRSKRGGAPHLEHEIERCRELEHWSKVEELAKKFKNREDSALSSAQFVTLGNFLTGEAKLEQYLQVKTKEHFLIVTCHLYLKATICRSTRL